MAVGSALADVAIMGGHLPGTHRALHSRGGLMARRSTSAHDNSLPALPAYAGIAGNRPMSTDQRNPASEESMRSVKD